MARDLHREPFKDSTLAKLNLFRNHLVAWLAVFVGSGMMPRKPIRIFDFFCGPGMDSNGQKGSPLLILEALKEFEPKIRAGQHPVDVYFNDFETDKVDELKQNIAQADLDAGPYQVHFYNQDFFAVFGLLYPSMTDSANLLLLDQHGFKFFSPDVFRQIRLLKQTDTLVFVSSSYVRRFKEQPEINQYLEAHKIFVDSETTTYYEVHRVLLEYYRSLVPGDEDYLLAPFSIKSGSNIYGIIFGTRSYLGLEKFLEAAWRMDAKTGEADFDIDREGITPDQGMFFGMDKPKKVQLFEEKLESEILDGTLSDTAKIIEFTLRQGFLARHARPTLKNLLKAGHIVGNITGFGYDSRKQPEKIQVVRK
jgi:three-Cys-motif partner protein